MPEITKEGGIRHQRHVEDSSVPAHSLVISIPTRRLWKMGIVCSCFEVLFWTLEL